ncbi:hypothetical protein [Pseudosporangium ferrugineum]|uniref:Uncharacterized protein n=1 Tax=Pseudosporangium ferrugineum TaxID=439699 RepID=A0A2T0RSF6_9ACTN|nr:hypothetical protein [Pseudosporangium ferrugineum]PRY24057.1 hypothetical protein CLV70_114190 [Pseudosporangium ferrugineum]
MITGNIMYESAMWLRESARLSVRLASPSAPSGVSEDHQQTDDWKWLGDSVGDQMSRRHDYIEGLAFAWRKHSCERDHYVSPFRDVAQIFVNHALEVDLQLENRLRAVVGHAPDQVVRQTITVRLDLSGVLKNDRPRLRKLVVSSLGGGKFTILPCKLSIGSGESPLVLSVSPRPLGLLDLVDEQPNGGNRGSERNYRAAKRGPCLELVSPRRRVGSRRRRGEHQSEHRRTVRLDRLETPQSFGDWRVA